MNEVICERCGQYESECRCDKPQHIPDEALRVKVELLELTLGYALIAYDEEYIEADEMDLYRDYVTDQILTLFDNYYK